MIVIYLSTFEATVLILFPAVLLMSGLILQFYLRRKIEVVDSVVQNAPNIGFYTAVSLAGLAAVSVFAPIFSKPYWVKMELTGMDALLYAVLIAISEEQFFRGAILSFQLEVMHPPLAMIGNAAIFTVYHFAVYGQKLHALAYVFGGGLILAWVTYKSGRLSPAMISHSINNVLAYIMR